jgi:hypothetical protein
VVNNVCLIQRRGFVKKGRCSCPEQLNNFSTQQVLFQSNWGLQTRRFDLMRMPSDTCRPWRVGTIDCYTDGFKIMGLQLNYFNFITGDRQKSEFVGRWGDISSLDVSDGNIKMLRIYKSNVK